MRNKLLLCLMVGLMLGITATAQDTKMQPLTFWYEYTVNPGKDAQFLEVVKSVGAPVRDKLLADGVILAWGVQVPLLREPGGHTHEIWFTVADWSGIQKVTAAMAAQIAKLDEEAAKTGSAKKGTSGGTTVIARMMEAADVSKTRDYLTRDLIFVTGKTNPPAGTLPFVRYNFAKVKPGKGSDFRKTWEKYNKPVLDKLVSDGVIMAYGFAVEELRTEGSFTHYVWYATNDLASMDKIRAAYTADRDHRSQEEQDVISAEFAKVLDLDASRSEMSHAIIFKVSGMK